MIWRSISEDSIIDSTGYRYKALIEPLYGRSAEDFRSLLAERAQERWNLKCEFAQSGLIGSAGKRPATPQLWKYSVFLRTVFLCFEWPQRFPWQSSGKSPDLESLYEIGSGMWTTRGTRPANYPRLRLSNTSIGWWRIRIGRSRKMGFKGTCR